MKNRKQMIKQKSQKKEKKERQPLILLYIFTCNCYSYCRGFVLSTNDFLDSAGTKKKWIK